MITGSSSITQSQATNYFHNTYLRTDTNLSFNSTSHQVSPEIQQQMKLLASPYLQLAENQQTEEYVHPFGEGITPIGVTPVGVWAESAAETTNEILEKGLSAGVVGGAILNATTRGIGKQIDIPESPKIDPKDVAGKTAAEIDQVAKSNGLIPKGDPTSGKGAYTDPVTEKQRVLIHPDPKTGCADPHCHVNDADGNRLDIGGNQVPAESPEAHLPLKTD